jgi:hypothetical protein
LQQLNHLYRHLYQSEGVTLRLEVEGQLKVPVEMKEIRTQRVKMGSILLDPKLCSKVL